MKTRRQFCAAALCLLLLLSGCGGLAHVEEALSSRSEAAISAPGPVAPSSVPEEPQNTYIQSLVSATAAQLSAAATNDMERVRTAYEYIVSSVTDMEPLGLDCWRYRGEQAEPAPPFLENRALSPLAFGAGRCEDSAAAMTLLLQAMGLHALYVPGLTAAADQSYREHAWVVVALDGSWYHLDPQLERSALSDGVLPYRYFLKSDAEMQSDHLWGKHWIAYGKSDDQALTQAQIDEIRASYLPPACPDTHPAPAPQEINLAPPPAPGEVQALLLQEKQLYEQTHGALPPLKLNVAPPVFGAASAPPENERAIAGAFWRTKLSAEEAALYDTFGQVAAQYLIGQVTAITPLSQTSFSAVWADWQNAHPQYYWARAAAATNARGEVSSFTLESDAALTPDQLRQRQQEVDAAAAALLENLPDDEFERIYSIHDRLINATYYTYTPGVSDAENLYGALVKQRGLCDGLSRAFQYLAQLSGVECLYVYGTTPWGTPHAWNAIQLEGEWYYVDVTWDLSRGRSDILHAYLLASWEDISREHIPDPALAGRLPEQTGTRGNYYLQRGYFARDPLDDPYQLAVAFATQLDDQTYPEGRRQTYTEIKILADEESFALTKNYAIDHVFSIISCINEIAEKQGLLWRIDKTGAVVVNYDDAAQVLTALLTVRKTT